MPMVSSRVAVAAPLEQVYALAKDIERFPEFMADVEEVAVLQQTPDGKQLSRWVGVVKEFGRKIVWEEEDDWDDEAHVCAFRQTEGDFSLYQGVWRFWADGEGTEITLQLEYEYDVPLIGDLIKGLLKRKMQQNADNMLAALKEEAEKE